MDNYYKTDISPEQFELIREDLEAAKKTTRPRKYLLYDIFCALLYILKTGCQWRNLPKDFPSWKIVYYYFTVWRAKKAEQPSILEVVLKKNNLKISKKFWKERGYKFFNY